MSKHYYNGKSVGTSLWIPPAQMGKKQLLREQAYLPRRYNAEECNYKLEAKTVAIQRIKKNGEPYFLKLVVGDQCKLTALVNTRDKDTGTNIRRCQAHLGEPLQTPENTPS